LTNKVVHFAYDMREEKALVGIQADLVQCLFNLLPMPAIMPATEIIVTI